MVSEAIKLEREKRKTSNRKEEFELLKTVVTTPIVTGFSLALVNHALYKTGWYQSNIYIKPGGFLGLFQGTISPQEAAVNMHDTIFLMIAAGTVIGSLKAGAQVSQLNPFS